MIAALQNFASEFQHRWKDRCLNENKIALDVYEANIIYLEGQELYEALNWRIPNQRGWGMQPFNEAAAFLGESGNPWQLRLDVPRVSDDGKVQKYESIKGNGAQVYFPNVPQRIRKLMSVRFGVDVPLEGSFWTWFLSSKEAKELPLFLTEGGTKCLAAISLGYPCISLYGCSSAWETRHSKYDKRQLMPKLRDAVRGHSTYFTFDQDTKPEAISRVQGSIKTIGRAVLMLTSEVRVLEWDSSQGKGLDDFIASQGHEGFEMTLKSALAFKDWKKSARQNWARSTVQQFGRKAIPDIVRNAPRVTDCGFPLPEQGQGQLINSPMGSGKTYGYATPIKALLAKHQGLIVDVIGHRNNLLFQTTDLLNKLVPGLNLIHVKTLGAGRLTDLQMNTTDALSYCIDSLRRRFDTLIRAIENGRKVLLVLDEVDALIKHLLLSTTLKPKRRIETITKFGILLEKVAEGGGYVIGGEAHLTALAVEALKVLSGGKMTVIVAENTVKPAPWNVQFCEGSRKATQKQAAAQFVTNLLREGKRVLLLTTSQEAAEQIDVYISQLLKLENLRLDGKTSSEPWAKGLFEDGDGVLSVHPARLVIGTPAIESGISMNKKGLFDVIVELSSGLEPSVSYQMLGRVRDASVPRFIFVEETSSNPGKFDPDAILKQYRTDCGFTIKQHGLKAEKQGVIANAHELAAKYLARESAGKELLEESLKARIKLDDHHINSQRLIVEVADSTCELLKAAKVDQIQPSFVNKWIELDDSKLTPDEARTKLREGDATYADRLLATKSLARERHGVKVDDRAFVSHFYADKWKGAERMAALRSAAQWENPGMASESDRRHLSHQISATGTIWGMGYRSSQRVFETLQKLNLHHLLDLPNGEQVTRDHWAVKVILKSAMAIPDEVKEVLGLMASTETNPMSFVSDLFRKFLGFEFDSERVTIPKPVQIEASEYSVHENHIDDPVYNFHRQSIPNTKLPPSKKRGRGRPKKAETTREYRYTLKPSLWREEVIADFIVAHNAYIEPEAVVEAEIKAVLETDIEVVETDPWFTSESLAAIRSQWEAAHTLEEKEALRQVIPMEVLERAIA